MRLFVAAYPPDEALGDLVRFLAQLEIGNATGLGAVRRIAASLHITLAFIGEVEEHLVAKAQVAVAEAAGVARPVELRLAGAGRFGST